MARLNRKFTVDNVQLEFDDGETPQFKIFEAFETKKEDALIIKAKVLTGDNREQKHTFFLTYEFKSGSENFNTTQFLQEFYSFDQLVKGDIELDELRRKIIRATCSKSKCGKFTNWQNFENLGGDNWAQEASALTNGVDKDSSLEKIPF